MFSASSASRERGVSAASSSRRKTSVSPNTEAVSLTVSGVCCSSGPRGIASAGVQAVAELVGEHEHVAPAARVVEHHVGVHARRRVRAEGAAALVRAHRSVDPALVEEALREVAEHGRELVEGAEHEVGGLGPLDRDLLVGDRGHAVVVGELVEAEQLGLEAVPAPRQVVVGAHGLEQRLHRLVAGLVGEVAARQPVRDRSAGGRRRPCPAAGC